MKEWLTVSLEKIYKISKELDIVDAAIVDYVYHLCASLHPQVQLKRTEGGTWIDFEHLLQECPWLGINNKMSISRRIEKLEKAGLLTKDRTGNQKLYIQPTEKLANLYLSTKTYKPR